MNNCDQLFNTLKREYQKSNNYTPKDLTTCINHPLIDTVMIDGNTFRNWDNQQDVSIDRPKDIKPHHCFLVSSNRDQHGNTLYIQAANNIGLEMAKQLVMPLA